MKRFVIALLLSVWASPSNAQPLNEIPIPPAPIVTQLEDLGEVDFNGIGLTPATPETGGFWANTSRSSVEPVLNELASGIKHPAIKAALVPLLTRGGKPPQGYPVDAAPFLVQRARVLYNQGAVQEAKQLLALVPQVQRRFAATQFLASMLVVEGKFEAGCPLVTDGLAMQNDALLLALQFVCAVKEEKPAAAELALSMLAESAGEYKGFLDLARTCTLGLAPDTRAPINADTATTALLRVCRWPEGSDIPISIDRTTPVPLLSLIATSTLVPSQTRLQAAELSTLHGAFTPARLKDVYEAVAGLSTQQDPSSLIGNSSQVWQQFKIAAGNSRWTLLSIALENSALLGTQSVVAKLYQPQLQDAVWPEDARLQKAAIRTAALYGSVLSQTNGQRFDDTSIMLYTWGWSRLSQRTSEPAAWDAGLLNRWRQRFGTESSALPLYLEAVGYPAALSAGKRRVSVLGKQIIDAQKQHADGLAVLTSVRVIANSFVTTQPPGDIAASYGALVRLGFNEAARSSAVALSLQQGL